MQVNFSCCRPLVGGRSAVKSNSLLILRVGLISYRKLGVLFSRPPPYGGNRANRVNELPGCLLYTGNLALVGKLAEADTADAELTKVSMGTAADLASGVLTSGELLLSLLLENHRFLCHCVLPPRIIVRRERPSDGAALLPLHRCLQWLRSRCPYHGSSQPCRTRFRGRSAAP